MNKKYSNKKLKYQKPTIISKKIKISFFMSKMTILDQFNIIGDIYAQSGGSGGDGGSWASTTTNNTGSTATPNGD